MFTDSFPKPSSFCYNYCRCHSLLKQLLQVLVIDLCRRHSAQLESSEDKKLGFCTFKLVFNTFTARLAVQNLSF